MVENIQIAVIGLGYVGIPLAVEFGKKISCNWLLYKYTKN